jgi:GTP-binding protein Era
MEFSSRSDSQPRDLNGLAGADVAPPQQELTNQPPLLDPGPAAAEGLESGSGAAAESAAMLAAERGWPAGTLLPGDYRSGFVALIGRPNVGKSTLLNQLVGQKVAITSPVAQTTRNRLRGILTTHTAQLVLLDTPGIHKPHHLLGQRLVQSARGAIGEVDVVLLLLDGSQPAGRGDAFVANLLRQSGQPVQVALNKMDQAGAGVDATAASYAAMLAEAGDPSWPVHPCSALTGVGCEQLVRALGSALPPGPHLYPPGEVSDQPEQLLLAELIREQVLHHTREEVPHSVAVQVERIVEEEASRGHGGRTAVLATVLVERSSQKAILIGRGGSMLRTIGQGARLHMQKLFDGPVYLELFVKVVPNWRRHPGRLAELGYRGD